MVLSVGNAETAVLADHHVFHPPVVQQNQLALGALVARVEQARLEPRHLGAAQVRAGCPEPAVVHQEEFHVTAAEPRVDALAVLPVGGVGPHLHETHPRFVLLAEAARGIVRTEVVVIPHGIDRHGAQDTREPGKAVDLPPAHVSVDKNHKSRTRA